MNSHAAFTFFTCQTISAKLERLYKLILIIRLISWRKTLLTMGSHYIIPQNIKSENYQFKKAAVPSALILKKIAVR